MWCSLVACESPAYRASLKIETTTKVNLSTNSYIYGYIFSGSFHLNGGFLFDPDDRHSLVVSQQVSVSFVAGHHELPPYNDSTKRSVYHVRSFEVFRLKQVISGIFTNNSEHRSFECH